MQYNNAWKHSRKCAFESFERKAKCQEDSSRGVIFNIHETILENLRIGTNITHCWKQTALEY